MTTSLNPPKKSLKTLVKLKYTHIQVVIMQKETLAAIRSNCLCSDAQLYVNLPSAIAEFDYVSLYCHEKKLNPLDPIIGEEYEKWKSDKKAAWKELAGKYGEMKGNELVMPAEPIPVGCENINPIDVNAINEYLNKEGKAYILDIVRPGKAEFLLADLNKHEKLLGRDVYLLGNEQERTVLLSFAYVGGYLEEANTVFVREGCLTSQFYDLVSMARNPRPYKLDKKAAVMVSEVLEAIGVDSGKPVESISGELDAAGRRFAEGVLKHEEAHLRHNDGNILKTNKVMEALGMDFSDSASIGFCRALEDMIADTHPEGRLNYYMAKKDAGSVYFFDYGLQNGGGPLAVQKKLMKNYGASRNAFRKKSDWNALKSAVGKDYAYALELAKQLNKVAALDAGGLEKMDLFRKRVVAPALR